MNFSEGSGVGILKACRSTTPNENLEAVWAKKKKNSLKGNVNKIPSASTVAWK